MASKHDIKLTRSCRAASGQFGDVYLERVECVVAQHRAVMHVEVGVQRLQLVRPEEVHHCARDLHLKHTVVKLTELAAVLFTNPVDRTPGLKRSGGEQKETTDEGNNNSSKASRSKYEVPPLNFVFWSGLPMC